MNDRQTIRLGIQKKRSQLSPTTYLQAAIEMSDYVANTTWFRRSRHIAFYQAVRGELDSSYLFQRAWEMGKVCYLPVCHPLHHQSLLFLPYFPGEKLIQNRYGIFEPDIRTHHPRKPFALDLVFTPLLAFDAYGNRLGSGKGYYDRTFAYFRYFPNTSRPLLVGLAYAFQEVAKISAESWDVPLDKMVIFQPSHDP